MSIIGAGREPGSFRQHGISFVRSELVTAKSVDDMVCDRQEILLSSTIHDHIRFWSLVETGSLFGKPVRFSITKELQNVAGIVTNVLQFPVRLSFRYTTNIISILWESKAQLFVGARKG